MDNNGHKEPISKRDNKGRWIKGAVGNPNGRTKTRKRVIKDFMKDHPRAYDEMMQLLYDIAKDKSDKDAAQYICDRLKGRPTQSVENKITGVITISPAELKLQVLALESTYSQLNDPTNTIPLIENRSEL